jgi:hypothetical protein
VDNNKNFKTWEVRGELACAWIKDACAWIWLSKTLIIWENKCVCITEE